MSHSPETPIQILSNGEHFAPGPQSVPSSQVAGLQAGGRLQTDKPAEQAKGGAHSSDFDFGSQDSPRPFVGHTHAPFGQVPAAINPEGMSQHCVSVSHSVPGGTHFPATQIS